MSKFKKVFIAFIIGLMLVFCESINAAEHANTNTYFSTGRSGGSLLKNSSTVVLDKPVPAAYSFALGNKYDKVTITGREPISSDDIEYWRNKKEGDDDTYTFRDYMFFEDENIHLTSYANDSIKGKLSATYENVGEYKNKAVDVKITVTDFERIDKDLNLHSDKTPWIVFLDKIGNNPKKIGVYIMNLDWVELKYEFINHKTKQPIKVKGYTTYWDVDVWQGFHLLEGNDKVYAKSNSELYINNINGASYVYDNKNELDHKSNYDTKTSFTELFSGTSIVRVFTVARGVTGESQAQHAVSRGWYWHSAVTPGAKKEYAQDSPAGENFASVKAGDEIKYVISYTNGDMNNAADVVIKDTISKGLEYVDNSSSLGKPSDIVKNSDGTTTLTWNTTLEKDSTASMSYSVKVTKDAIDFVSNHASVKIGDDPAYDMEPLTNPVPTKQYASDTPNGADGAEVSVGDDIKYSIKLPNVKGMAPIIKVTDVLSKGLAYNDDAVISDGTIKNKSFNVNSDGTTTITLTIALEEKNENTVPELTYSAKVTNAAKKIVNNNASAQYDDDPVIQLNELKNPIKTQIIRIPDTGSVVSIAGIIIGLSLVGAGSYFVYRKYTNA